MNPSHSPSTGVSDKAKLVKLESERNTLIKQTEEVKHLNEEILKTLKEDEIEIEIMKSCDFTEETEEVLVIIDKFLKENTQSSFYNRKA